MKNTAILALILASTSAAFAAPGAQPPASIAPAESPAHASIQPHAVVYVVPSDASPRFSHFIEHPPLGAGGLRKAALQISATSAGAAYSIACKPVRVKEHSSAVNHLIGGSMPGWSSLEVRALPSDSLIYYKERNTGGGTDKRRDDMAARICAAELSRLIER